MTNTRAEIVEMFAELSRGIEHGELSTSAYMYQRTRVVDRTRRRCRDVSPRVAKPPTKRVHAPGRGKAQHEALRASPERWAAKLAYMAAYKAAARVRDKPRGHNTRKLSDAAIADIRASADSVSALARKHGVDRAAIRYHRSRAASVDGVP